MVWPWAVIRTTIARRSRTGFFAVLALRGGSRPSSIGSGGR
jgi:hypothetical protein